MRYRTNPIILLVSAGALWQRLPSAFGQWLPVPHPGSSSNVLSSKINYEFEFKDDISPETTLVLEQEQKQEYGEGDDDDDEETVPIDTEHAKINPSGASDTDTDPDPNNTPEDTDPVPITAVLFDGSAGPKDCRGTAILKISLEKPGAAHTTPTCYNLPSTGTGTGSIGVAQCANFIADKDDGCQARVFSQPDCRNFVNVAVFTPEKADFGGFMRSVEITCGVVSTVPPPLDLPGLKLPPGAMQAVG